MKIATTKLSSRGQVVIPEEIRRRLGLEPGEQFVVLGEGDTVILRKIRPPSFEEFDSLLAQAREAAQRVGLEQQDLEAVIDEVRGEP
jgi:AbrB family looped-hinge helix DNA binding protein